MRSTLPFARNARPKDLTSYEKKIYSQNGEDGLIEEIFKRIGTRSKFAVEFGVEDGRECNTRLLIERGWNVLQMDGHDDNPPSIKHEFITAENINRLFRKYKVPHDLDMLCIDVDSNDFWIWKALDTKYRPRLVVIEYNASFSPAQSRTVAYDPKLTWDGSMYFGASLLALDRLARAKGYRLVCCDQKGVNAFFVREDLLDEKLEAKTPAQAYRGPGYGTADKDGVLCGHPGTDRAFVEITEAADGLQALAKPRGHGRDK